MDDRLQRYATPYNITANTKSETPLSFKNWIRENYGIIPSNAEKQYQAYLLSWYQDDKIAQTESASKVRNDYATLLDNLRHLFKNDKDLERLATVDVDDGEQLKIALPYFAQKLKELAIYYINKREEIKTVKIQRNLKGSEKGLEAILRNKLLNKFSVNNTTIGLLDSNDKLPDTTNIYKDLEITIQELNDYTDYSLSANSVSIENSSDNPLFFVFSEYVSLFYNAFSLDELPLSAQEFPYNVEDGCVSTLTLNHENIIALNEKYLGENYNYVLGGYYTTAFDDIIWNIAQGNNTFLFPGSSYQDNIYSEISLDDLELTDGTFSFELSTSDIIIVDDGYTLKGAWYGAEKDTLIDNFSATMQNGKTFKLPFPGFGKITNDYTWTGPQLNDHPDKTQSFFPTKNETVDAEKTAEEYYWSTDFSLTAFDAFSIHDSSLIEQGAYANFKYSNADKISVNNANFAWLYDIQRTQIPITYNTNNIYFPLQRYNSVAEIVIDYPETDQISLSSLDINDSFLGGVASYDLDKADMIIEIDSFGQEISAAWLYSDPIDYKDAQLCDCKYDPTVTIDIYKKIDAHILMDNSGSMTGKDPVTQKTKYQISKEALIDFAAQDTVANIRISFFNKGNGTTGGGITTKWFDVSTPIGKAEFVTYCKTGFPIAKGRTNYAEILERCCRVWSRPSNSSELQHIYFISDGNPNPGDTYINAARQSAWEAFLTTNSIDSCFAIGIPPIMAGNDKTWDEKSAQQNLKNVAYPKVDNPNIPNDDHNMVILNSAEDLRQFLYSTNIRETIERTLDQVYYTGLIYSDGSKQPSLSFKVESGRYHKFIWEGSSSDINNIKEFGGFSHEKYCPYDGNNGLIPSSNQETYHEEWSKCSCQSVYRSPIGHTGNIFSENYAYADYIVLDNMPEFDSKLWRGRDGLPIGESSDFAWFKLDAGQDDLRVGWGTGQWVDGQGNAFVLAKGELYNYIRNSLPNSPATELPYFVINHPYCQQDYCYWKKAVKNENGDWIDDGTIADLSLSYGKKYVYVHRPESTFKIQRFTLNGRYVTEEYVEYAPTDGVISTETREIINGSTNFLMTIDLDEATPFWAKASYRPELNNLLLPQERTVVFDYVQHTQPQFSDIIFQTGDVIVYEKDECSASPCFVWEQPISLKITNPDITGTWFNLDIDPCYKSDILNVLINGSCKVCERPYSSENEGKCDACYSELPTFIKEIFFGKCGCDANICDPTVTVFTPTFEPNTITFNKEAVDSRIRVTYLSQAGFTKTIRLANINNGLPPSGGLWVEEASGTYASATEPWKNLLNSEYAVVTTTVNTDKIYPVYELGLNVPSMLGLGKYEIKKGNIIYTNTDNLTGTKLFRDPKYYIDAGFQLDYLDSSWMKIQTGLAKGSVIPSKHKRFLGYTNDITDINQYNEYIHSSASDVYGNNYMLLKNDNISIHERRRSNGEFIVKDWQANSMGFADFHEDFMAKLQTFDRVVTADISIYDDVLSTTTLSTIDVLFSPYSEITANNIKNINVFYDIIGIETDSAYTLFRTLENSDGTREAEFNTIHVIEKNNINHWFDVKNNIIWLCNLDESPIILTYNINTNQLKTVYSDTSVWDFSFSVDSVPFLTKNENTLHLAFVTEISELSSSYIITTTFGNLDQSELSCGEIVALSGEFGNKQILEYYPQDGYNVLLLETQAVPNEIVVYKV